MLRPPRPVDEDARLAGLTALGIMDTPREERFDRVVRLTARTVGAPMAALSFIDRDREWFKSGHGWTAKELPRRDSLGAHAILGTGAFVLEDLQRDPRFKDHPLVQAGIRSYAGVPLRGPDGGLVGVLAVMGPRPCPLGPDALQALQEAGLLAEDELQASRGPARDAALMGSLLHAMAVPVAAVAADGRLLFANDAWREEGPQELLGPAGPGNLLERLDRVDGLHRQAAAALAEALREVLSGRRSAWSAPLGRGGAGGRLLQITVRPLAGLGAALLLEDRTDAGRRAALEDALVDQGLELEALRARAVGQGRAIQALAQELNTPPTPVRLQLHLLRSRRLGGLDPRQERALATIARNVERWTALDASLLGLLQDDRVRPQEHLDLRHLAVAMVADHRTKALQDGIELVPPREGAPVPVTATGDAIQEVLARFLDLAMDRSGAGDRIEVEVDAEGREGVLVVRAAGGGMRPQEAAHLFEAQPERALEPHHLGLVRCRGLVEADGGRVGAEADGHAAALMLALPLRQV